MYLNFKLTQSIGGSTISGGGGKGGGYQRAPCEREKNIVCILTSVRLRSFKDVGPYKVRFLTKNQHTSKEKSLKNSCEECQFIKNWA